MTAAEEEAASTYKCLHCEHSAELRRSVIKHLKKQTKACTRVEDPREGHDWIRIPKATSDSTSHTCKCGATFQARRYLMNHCNRLRDKKKHAPADDDPESDASQRSEPDQQARKRPRRSAPTRPKRDHADEPATGKHARQASEKPITDDLVKAVAQAADVRNGERIRIWWSDDKCWYFAKVIDSKVAEGFQGLALLHQVRYELDRDERWHELRREHWTRAPKARQTSRGSISLAEVSKALESNYDPPLSEGDGRSEATMSEADGEVSEMESEAAESVVLLSSSDFGVD